MTWERICNRIKKYARVETEQEYEGSLCDILIEDGLKWSSNNIKRQDSVRIGSMQSLRPDIIVYKDDKPQFIIEVKKPTHKQSVNDITQLVSYMKQLEVKVGIYIGEKIDVYYKQIGSGLKEVTLLTVSFDPNDKAGDLFCKLFNANNFSDYEIENYYKNWLKEQEETDIIEKEISFLESREGKEIIELFLKNHFISRHIETSIANKIIDSIDIQLTRKNSRIHKPSENASEKNPGSSKILQENRENNPIKISQKKSRFKFSIVGIKEGEEVIFIPTGQKVKVVGEDTVELNGEIKKLTPMAKKLMPADLRTPSESYQGPKFFAYKGKKLTDLRAESEQ